MGKKQLGGKNWICNCWIVLEKKKYPFCRTCGQFYKDVLHLHDKKWKKLEKPKSYPLQ